MDIFSAHAFIPGNYPAKPEPLGRFLPVIPTGVVQKYLAEANIPEGAYILDPFGASTRFIMEMARSGYRVLAAINNPITRFMMEIESDPPTQADLQSALSELASSRKGEERLETHLQSLYLTNCPHCQSSIPAQAFTWERNAAFPSTRILHCTECGIEGEFETTPEDHKIISRLTNTKSLHEARALERVAAIGDPDRKFAQEALEYYLPRAIYGLITIINKLDGLSITPRQHRDLTALLLTVCDETNTLWAYPTERPRPRQLVIPPRFREINIWLALEKSVETWASSEKDSTISIWPTLPTDHSSICIFEGTQRELVNHLESIPVQAVVSVLPRPNQAFWSLSALWAGWLWGREAVAPFKGVLRRQRYDWNWHATAMYAAFKNLYPHLSIIAPVFTLLPEPEPSFLSAALLAASSSGFNLQAIALRSTDDPVQIHWQKRAFLHKETTQIEASSLQQALKKYLEKRGEPVSYLTLHAACLAHMAEIHCLNWQGDALVKLHAPIQEVLNNGQFNRYGGSLHSLEIGLWGLGTHSFGISPLADEVEIEVVQILTHNPGASQEEIEVSINQKYPGLYTPQLNFVSNVLTSYAIQTDNGWVLRPEDSAKLRKKDLKNMTSLLETLGKRLGYQVAHSENNYQAILWLDNGSVIYSYHIKASAVIGKLITQGAASKVVCCLVIPGGRAGLLSYKLDRNPALKSFAQKWQILKYRQIRSLAEDKTLTRQDWIDKMGSDPITQPEQMRLL